MRMIITAGRAPAAYALIAAGAFTALAPSMLPAQVFPPGLEPFASYSATALGIPNPLGGLVFDASGQSIVIGGGANGSSGALYRVFVTRDPVTNRVIGLGPPVVVGPAPNIDGGLAMFAGTWFYTRYPMSEIGQLNGAGTVSVPLPSPLGGGGGGLTFVPAGPANAGSLLVSRYNGGGSIYRVAYSPDGSGFYNLGPATLYASWPSALEGLAFIPTGPLAGDLLVSEYGNSRVSVLDVDPVTGLPVGGANAPVITPLISVWSSSEGVAVDPLTGDLWLARYGDTLLHVVGLDSLAPLEASVSSVSVGGGASVGFRLRAGTARAGRSYVLAASLSGTAPGTPVGSVIVPLNLDALTLLVLDNLNSIFFSGFLGILDANGAAGADLNVPPLGLPGPAGVDFAFLLLSPEDFASNAKHLTLLP